MNIEYNKSRARHVPATRALATALSALLLTASLAVLLLPLAACSREEYRRITIFTMDTPVTIQINSSYSGADHVLAECERILNRLDGLLSRTREGSDVWRINHNLVTEGLDADTVALLRTAIYVSEQTDGAFDVTVAPLIELWETCRDAGRLPEESELERARGLVDYRALTLEGDTLTKSDADVRIDLGGIAKGYAADVVADYLRSCGVEYGLVNFDSCIAAVGEKPDGSPFRIAIRDPSDTSGVVGYVTLDGGVLSVTGDYERYYEIDGQRYHHVLSPRTGRPAETVWHSVAVVCGSGAVADAMSTALFVAGDYERYYAALRGTDLAFEGVFTGDGGTSASAGIAADFEPAK